MKQRQHLQHETNYMTTIRLLCRLPMTPLPDQLNYIGEHDNITTTNDTTLSTIQP